MSKGGKLLGSGSYGCVFQPSLKCKGKRKVKNKNSLSKIYFRNEGLTEATQEYDINSQIKRIKGYNKWASIYTEQCTPESYSNMKNEEKELDECENLHKNSNIVMLQGTFDGVELDTYVVDNIINPYYSNNGIFIDKYQGYLKLFKNILKGLADMNDHNMCHLDIKLPNMVINKNVIKLIDFGLSNNSMNEADKINKRAYSELRNISRFYPPYPPEYIYSCTYGNYEEVLSKELSLLRNGDPPRKYHSYIKNIHEELVKDVGNFDKYIKNLIIRNLDNPLSTEEKKDLYDKIDIYSVGMLFITIFKSINGTHDTIDDDVINIINDPKINPFIVLACKMIHLDYTKRISASDAYIEYCEILKRVRNKRPNRKNSVKLNMRYNKKSNRKKSRNSSNSSRKRRIRRK